VTNVTNRFLLNALAAIWLIPLLAATPPPAQDPSPSPVAVSNPFVVKVSALKFRTCLDFKNVSDKPIQAVRFGFAYGDAFGGVTDGIYGDRTGTFGPGVMIAGPGQHPNAFQLNDAAYQNCWVTDQGFTSVSSLSVSVLKVIFADGTTWQSQTPPAPAATITFQPPL
jgi:hypothetical protein